jgi:hypothetical protein
VNWAFNVKGAQMPNNLNNLSKTDENSTALLSKEMVKCTRCGVCLPVRESYLIGGKYYCSEHRSHSISTDGKSIDENMNKPKSKNQELHKKGLVWLIVAFIFIAIFFSKTEKVVPPTPVDVDPNYQVHFEQARTNKVKDYNKGSNEIQKSAIFNQANAETANLIAKNGAHFVGWAGKISSLTTSHGGKDVFISIDSPGNATYRINEDAPNGSTIYEQLASMKVGQKVKFSGTLIPSDNSDRWERSITEFGSLTNPEFNVAFDDIEATNLKK